jgi:hypothetical protein
VIDSHAGWERIRVEITQHLKVIGAAALLSEMANFSQAKLAGP